MSDAVGLEPSGSVSPAFYRFRSLDAVLGDRAELEKQEIFFAPSKALNDPMEGFLDLVWQGDEILWRNLLRQYLLAILHGHTIVMLAGNDFGPKDRLLCEGLVHWDVEDLPEAPVRDVYAELCEVFLRNDVAQLLITKLAEHRLPVRRDELSFYLRALTPFAYKLMRDAVAKHGIPAGGGIETRVEEPGYAFDQLDSLKRALLQYPQDAAALEVLFEISAIQMMQLNLIYDFGSRRTPAQEGVIFLLRDFPTLYVESLERLVYPEWRTACFVSDPTDASMWGAYAEGHTGVCLKFRSLTAANGSHSLDLNQATAIGGGRNDTTTYFGYRPLLFEPVRYAEGYPTIDFFRSLGTLPIPKLSRSWYGDGSGGRSEASKGILGDSSEWRSTYWEAFQKITLTKMLDWAHEREHRLIFRSSFDQPPALQYRFESLAGLCFGVKTPQAEKLKIMRIIERKCVASGRTDFEFCQARYSSRTKRIEVVPLDLLKVSLGVADAPESYGDD